MSGIGKIGKTN